MNTPEPGRGAAPEDRFSAILRSHGARYPRMTAQDYGKLAYQSEFGPEHLVADGARVRERLQAEWEGLPPDLPPREPEPIGNGLCRFHLAGGQDTGLAVPVLAALFLRTAREHAGTPEGLERRLESLRALDVPGMEPWLAEYRRQGCPAVRHSREFRDAYQPHYRVIRRAYAGWFPALLAVEALVRAGRPAVVAIDGRCGSGKSSLAGLLQALYPCNVFHMDDFYLPPEHRAPGWEEVPGGNMDLERLRSQVLLPVLRGGDAAFRPYDCAKGAYGPEVRARARPLTVIEGSYSLHPALDVPYDLALFLTCSPEAQRRRLLAREGAYFPVFARRWIPLEERYLQSCRPQDRYALTLDTSDFFDRET